jgi:Spy/CpxP family protein refolding chaperone
MPENEEVAVTVLPNTTEEEVTFTPAQQQKLDAILKNAMGRAGSDARAEAERLRVENERLKAQAIGAAPDTSEIEKLRGAVADGALRAEAAERRATAQSKAILQAKLAAQIDAIAPDDVAKLLKDNLSYNATDKRFDCVG